jgi:hypothetical protein
MSRFKNKQFYTDVFPLSRVGLVGTEYQYQTQPQQFDKIPKSTTIKEFKKQIQKSTPNETQTIERGIIPSIYNEKLQEEIPKSQLDLPLQVALKATYPEQLSKVKDDLGRYGYYIDFLTDEEHVVLVNPSKKKVIFGVRGTNVLSTADITTDLGLTTFDIKTFNRYKKAQEKYKEVKSKFGDIPIIHASHSLGGLISSQLAQPEDIVYSYNRPFFSYPIQKNEISISVKSDPLLLTRLKGQKPTIIPRTFYEPAKDYLAIQKTKINPDFEEKPIEIPKQYKTDLPNVQYKNIIAGVFPVATFAKDIYQKYVTRPEQYRQSLIANLQQQATTSQERLDRISSRILPRSRSVSPRSLGRLQTAIQRPFTAIEQNILNPTVLDTTKRAIRQIMRNPSSAFYDVLGHPLLGYAIANYAGGYATTRASASHSIENLPLNVRIK